MEQVVNAVLEAMLRSGLVQVEVSARHVHLSAQDLVTLFGPGAALTAVRPLSQPGQFLAGERVTVIGPKGRFERTAILGPSGATPRSSWPSVTSGSSASQPRCANPAMCKVRARSQSKVPVARWRCSKA
ncbi:MAG: hypothetical protein LRY35_05165 [Clostridiales bacterium]|nr:hypothetical protein [Clostridiales bacterium]